MTNQTTTDRILSDAETENIRRPVDPYVPIGIELAKSILTTLDNYEKKRSEWVQADADLIEKIENYRLAEQNDRAALDKAARAGKDAPPAPDAPALLRAIEFATLKAMHAREAADAAADAVKQAIAADIQNISDAAMTAILESNDRLNQEFADARRAVSTGINRHNALMNNMRFVIQAAKPELGISDQYATWTPPQVTWPEPRHLEQITLRQMFANIRSVKDRNRK